MSNTHTKNTKWSACSKCHGQGNKSRGLTKKEQNRYQQEVTLFEKKNDVNGSAPIRPKAQLHTCLSCNGTGIVPSEHFPIPDTENYPNIVIIGAGIGGVAFAVACLQRGIPFTLFERDENFYSRAQGYGLTLQQASKVIRNLGITHLKEGVISNRHVVHTTDGKIIGEWGARKWLSNVGETKDKRKNIHIARQSLRHELLEQLDDQKNIKWGHQLISLSQNKKEGIRLDFQVEGALQTFNADLVVGADGIRSSVRKHLISEKQTPLRYLDCLVILGICPLKDLGEISSSLLDSATVFQTANGNERIYMMPFTQDTIMWQLSFPMNEEEAKRLSEKGPEALKEEAKRRTQWHAPIPLIIATTKPEQISGYPVYDRELLTSETLQTCGQVTLIGDAAHPMSPFKGQGANQALLDALHLAKAITKYGNAHSRWREVGVRNAVLTNFEAEMLERSAVKVKGSADAAVFLHSDVVLQEGNQTRGSKKD